MPASAALLNRGMSVRAYHLSDLPEPHVTIICASCSRRGRYAVRRLIEKHGDLPCPTLLTVLSADCPQRQRLDGRCGVLFERSPDAMIHGEAPIAKPWTPRVFKGDR